MKDDMHHFLHHSPFFAVTSPAPPNNCNRLIGNSVELLGEFNGDKDEMDDIDRGVDVVGECWIIDPVGDNGISYSERWE